MRNQLENYASEKLKEKGVVHGYEPYSIVLLPSFTARIKSIEKISKKFKEKSEKIRPITYKPDFVGDGWLMETKGFRREEFNLKWKMLKHLLTVHQLPLTLYMPTNQKEVDISIEQILTNGQNKRIFRFPKGFELAVKAPGKSTPDKAKNGKSGNRRRRQSTLSNRRSSRLSTDLARKV